MDSGTTTAKFPQTETTYLAQSEVFVLLLHFVSSA